MALVIEGKPRMKPALRRIVLSGSGLRSSKKEQSEDNISSLTTDDPLRILAPGQKKLTAIESQRVLAVMDTTINRMDYALLLPYLSSYIDRFSVSLGEKLVGLLQEYSHLVDKHIYLFESLELDELPPMASFSSQVGLYEPGLDIASLSSSDSARSSISYSGHPVQLESLTDQNTFESMEAKFQQVRFRLRMNIKCILRELGISSYPSGTSLERSRNAQLLQDSISKLRGIIHEKLLMTHAEEVKRKEYLDEVHKRQLLAEQQIKSLQIELAEEQRKKNEMVSEKNAEIKRLKSTIKGVVNLAHDGKRRMKAEALDKQNHEKIAHNTGSRKLKEDIGNLEKNLKEVMKENQDKEQMLRKRAFKRETELENWIQKYDHEMGEKQDELEQVEEEYATEKTRLHGLEEKLGVLTLEYVGVVKEQEVAKAKAIETKNKLLQMVTAAQLIQRTWRLYRSRKAQKGKKKKKKGKKRKR